MAPLIAPQRDRDVQSDVATVSPSVEALSLFEDQHREERNVLWYHRHWIVRSL